jgi:hypothetical protein
LVIYVTFALKHCLLATPRLRVRNAWLQLRRAWFHPWHHFPAGIRGSFLPQFIHHSNFATTGNAATTYREINRFIHRAARYRPDLVTNSSLPAP